MYFYLGKSKQNYPINHAAWYGHYRIVSYLLDHGADVSTQGHLNMTPLNMATARNHIDTVNILIDAGAKLDAQTRDL